jgi:predicted ribosome quality control (RQC) complex YloA/Tae2 family protein
MRISKFKKFLTESKNKFPNIKTVIIDDFTVLMGRDAESNDYLSFKMANQDDLWFHAKGLPGSHVVLKVRDKLPSPELIKKVGAIAAKNSKATGTCKVVYCKAKFLSKTSDMKPGQVSVDYLNSEEIEVEI